MQRGENFLPLFTRAPHPEPRESGVKQIPLRAHAVSEGQRGARQAA